MDAAKRYHAMLARWNPPRTAQLMLMALIAIVLLALVAQVGVLFTPSPVFGTLIPVLREDKEYDVGREEYDVGREEYNVGREHQVQWDVGEGRDPIEALLSGAVFAPVPPTDPLWDGVGVMLLCLPPAKRMSLYNATSSAVRTLTCLRSLYPHLLVEVLTSRSLFQNVSEAFAGFDNVDVVLLRESNLPEEHHGNKAVALSQSKFDTLLFLDTDARPCPSGLEKLLLEMARGNENGCDVVGMAEPGPAAKRDEHRFEWNSGVVLYNTTSSATQRFFHHWEVHVTAHKGNWRDQKSIVPAWKLTEEELGLDALRVKKIPPFQCRGPLKEKKYHEYLCFAPYCWFVHRAQFKSFREFSNVCTV